MTVAAPSPDELPDEPSPDAAESTPPPGPGKPSDFAETIDTTGSLDGGDRPPPPPADPSSPPLPTTNLGPYRVIREIGRGGMGVVYLAHDERLGRDVAVKALPRQLSADPERLSRFRTEARMVAQLNHPHIAQIHQLFEHDEGTFLVLEFIPGESLSARIAARTIDANEALALTLQIARALDAAHQKGVVHRDLKPGNIMVTPESRAKVLDFGVAQQIGGPASEDSLEPEGPVIVGTPGYMSPEQARGRVVDARADIFALGSLLFETLALRPAFPGASIAERLRATLDDDPPWDRLPATLPDPIVDLLRRCLAKKESDRTSTAIDVVSVLEPIVTGVPSLHAPPPADAPHNLPPVLDRFVGRESILRELALALKDTALITLTGSGGCGKTRLAVELARRSLDRYPDGVYLAELASTTEPGRLSEVVSAALETPSVPGQPVSDSLIAQLRERRMLLIIDNCEHLIEAAANLVAPLLEACPHLRIVTTSREALGIAGEHTRPVPSLSLPRELAPNHPTLSAPLTTTTVDLPALAGARDREAEEIIDSEAVALFLDRASEARDDFVMAPEDGRTIAAICRRLDGIPLAIELAAARVQVLSVDQIHDRLSDRFRLLGGGGRGAVERHRTLRAAVDWSYRLLDQDEQRMLRRLSVFSSGWNLDGALTVCGAGGGADGEDLDEFELLDGLSRLVDKSLVVAEEIGGEPRYRMLETVQQFAAEERDREGETLGARDQLVRHFWQLARTAQNELVGPDQADWLERLQVALEDVLEAIRWGASASTDILATGEHAPDSEPSLATMALDIGGRLLKFWDVRGPLLTVREVMEQALRDVGENAEALAIANGWNAVGWLAYRAGNLEAAHSRLNRALQLKQKSDLPGISVVLGNLGVVARRRGDLDEAERYYQQALESAREEQKTVGEAVHLGNLGLLAKDRQDLVQARSLISRSLSLYRDLGDRSGAARQLGHLGVCAQLAGEFSEARRYFEECLSIHEELGDLRGMAGSLGNLGVVASQERNEVEARARVAQCLRLFGEIQSAAGLASAFDEAALLAVQDGAPELAARWTGAADAGFELAGVPRDPEVEPRREASLGPARSELQELWGNDAWPAAVARGRELPLPETLAEVLDWLERD